MAMNFAAGGARAFGMRGQDPLAGAPVVNENPRRITDLAIDEKSREAFISLGLDGVTDPSKFFNLYFGEPGRVTSEGGMMNWQYFEQAYAGRNEYMSQVCISMVTAEKFPIFHYVFTMTKTKYTTGFETFRMMYPDYIAERLPYGTTPKVMGHKQQSTFTMFGRWGTAFDLDATMMNTPIGAFSYFMQMRQMATALMMMRESVCTHALFEAYQNRTHWIRTSLRDSNPDPYKQAALLIRHSNWQVGAVHKDPAGFEKNFSDALEMVPGANTVVVPQGFSLITNRTQREFVRRMLTGPAQAYILPNSERIETFNMLGGMRVITAPKYVIHGDSNATTPFERRSAGASFYWGRNAMEHINAEKYLTSRANLKDVQDFDQTSVTVGIEEGLLATGRFLRFNGSLQIKPESYCAEAEGKVIYESFPGSHSGEQRFDEEDLKKRFSEFRVLAARLDAEHKFSADETEREEQKAEIARYNKPNNEDVDPLETFGQTETTATRRELSFDHVKVETQSTDDGAVTLYMQTIGKLLGTESHVRSARATLVRKIWDLVRDVKGGDVRNADGDIVARLSDEEAKLEALAQKFYGNSPGSLGRFLVNVYMTKHDYPDKRDILDWIPLCEETVRAFCEHNIPHPYSFGLFQYYELIMGCIVVINVDRSQKFYQGITSWKVNMDPHHFHVYGYIAEYGGARCEDPDKVYIMFDACYIGYCGGLHANPFDLSQHTIEATRPHLPYDTISVLLPLDFSIGEWIDLRGYLCPMLLEGMPKPSKPMYFDPEWVLKQLGYDESQLLDGADDQLVNEYYLFARGASDRFIDPRETRSQSASMAFTNASRGTCRVYDYDESKYVYKFGTDRWGHYGTCEQRMKAAGGGGGSFSDLTMRQVEVYQH